MNETIFERLDQKQKRERKVALSEINQVLTVAEVCAGWHRHEKTVRQAISYGNIIARKSGKTHLISYSSVVAWWGEPVETLIDRIHEQNEGDY